MRRTIDSSERSPTNGSQDITTLSHTINYFNHNFCENSDSSRQGIASTGTKSKSNSDNFQAGDESKKPYHQLRRPLRRSFGMQLLEKDASDDIYTERTLTEIGFNSTKVSNWDKIVQPHKTDMLILLEKMIKNYEKTNVQIRIADTTFNCHMMVLQCYSDFFMELNNEQLVVLPADKVTPEAFFMVYDWMLSSKPMVQREGMLELFNAAQFLKIKGLVDQCWVCLDDDEHFCEDAAFLLYLEARKYDHELIQQLMLSRICKFFLTLVASKEFLELTPKEVCTLLQSNTIGVNMETEVLMAAVRWLNHNWEEREKHLLELISCVRFGLMTPWQLVELRKNTDSPEIQRVVNCPEVQKMIDDGLSYVTTKYWYASNSENLFHLMERLNLTEPVERQWIKDKTWSENFECPNQMYSCYKSFLEYLDMIRKMGTEHWKTLECYEGSPNLVVKESNQRDQCTQVQVRNMKKSKIVKNVANKDKHNKQHFVQERKTPETQSYDGRTSVTKTKVLQPMFFKNGPITESSSDPDIKSRNDTREAIVGTSFKSEEDTSYTTYEPYIYLFGGIDPLRTDFTEGQGKDVVQYDIKTNSWSLITTMPGSRHHHSAVYYKGKIYVIAGTRPANKSISQSISKSVWSFDPVTMQWRNEKNLPYPRRDFGLIATTDGIYVIGGEDDIGNFLSSMIFFNEREGDWIEKEPMLVCRTGLAVALIKNEIWAAGGIIARQNGAITDRVEAYDLNTCIWTEIGYLRKARSFARLCVVQENEIFIIGGVVIKDKVFSSLSSIDKFFYDTKQWKEVTTMTFARHGHDAVVVDDRIYIFGGVSLDIDSTLRSVECYCVSQSKWINSICSLPVPLSGLSALGFYL